MRNYIIAAAAALFTFCVTTPLLAQYPVPVAQPHVVQYPVQNHPVQNYTVQRPVVVSQPHAVYYAPAAPAYYAQPQVVYRPYIATPRVTYYNGPYVGAPIAPAYYPRAYYSARPVIVRSKVFIPGQPIRNALRAITP